MSKLTQEQLNEILDLHALWFKGRNQGKQADFYGKDLSRLDLSYRNINYANFRNSNCQGANFRNSNCREADFRWANCREADFYMANCIGTNFTDANCQNVNFKWTNCLGINFTNANCKEADFRWANCKGANLQDVELQDATVSCIKGKVIASTQGIQGECGRQITLLAEGEEKDWVIFCGCFTGNRKELRKWLNCKNREDYKLESTRLSISYLFKLCRMQHKQLKQNNKPG